MEIAVIIISLIRILPTRNNQQHWKWWPKTISPGETSNQWGQVYEVSGEKYGGRMLGHLNNYWEAL